MIFKRALAASLVFALVTPAFAEGPAFLFDLLREKSYKASWEALMKSGAADAGFAGAVQSKKP